MRSGNLIFILFCLLTDSISFAQFSPPGLGNINTASWFAIGVKQKLNDKKTISSATFIGMGKTSNPDNYNFLQRSVIYVVNQEVTHHFAMNWEYTGALSYRWQNHYSNKIPYELQNSTSQQEIRTYGKLSYLNHLGTTDYSLTFRPELRFFFNPNFNSAEKKMQFRTRFQAKMNFALNASKTKEIITSAEILLCTNKSEKWDRYQFNESRFCIYYSVKLPQQNMTLNLGYMNDLLLKPTFNDAHYLAVDITLNDLF